MSHKCPFCGRFVGRIQAKVNQEDDIKEVSGLCYQCGRVKIEDWEYEDFFPDE